MKTTSAISRFLQVIWWSFLLLALGGESSVLWADSSLNAILARSYERQAISSILDRSANRSTPKSSRRLPPRELPAKGRKNIGDYASLIEQYSATHGLDPNLVKAVIQAESGGDANALSPRGAAGLMQLMPATAADLGTEDRFDPEQNIASGTRYLSKLMHRFQSVELALWAYNAGPEAVRQGRLPLETQEYVPRVLRLRRAFAQKESN